MDVFMWSTGTEFLVRSYGSRDFLIFFPALLTRKTRLRTHFVNSVGFENRTIKLIVRYRV